MAVGFTPKFKAQMFLEDLSPEQFLVIAIESAEKLDWDIGYKSRGGLIAYTNKGIFKRNAKITIRIQADIVLLESESTGNEMVDMGMNKKNINLFISIINQVKTMYPYEELTQRFDELKGSLPGEENDELKLPPPTNSEKLSEFISLFKPRTGYYITPLLVDLNILIFILMVISGVNFFLPDNDSLIRWGANFRPITLGGEPWRLVTNCFLHIGIIHLLFNMYALIYIGLLLEPFLGKTRFLSAYLLTGLVASLTSIAWHDLTISAGASGAIFGMYGVFLAMLTTNFIEKATRKAFLSSIAIFVTYNLLNGLKEGVDNAAHIGGLVSGLIIGYSFYPSLKKPAAISLKYSIIGILAIIVLTTSFVAYKKIPNDIGTYDAKMNEFAANEQTALAIYRLPQNASVEDELSSIKDSGIYNWNKNIKLLNETQKLNIPQSLKDKDDLLLKYCNLRLSDYAFIYKQIHENTDMYKDSIAYYDSQIEAVINELKASK
jgi:membrane associated rhomboid family serine protease